MVIYSFNKGENLEYTCILQVGGGGLSPYLSTRFNNYLYWNDETTRSYLELFEGKTMYELG